MLKSTDNFDIFSGIYRGKRVLVTGHTGFKGSWLSLWLLKLGANVAGFSLYLPSDPCNFKAINLKKKIRHYKGDIRNIKALRKVFHDFRPQVVFHLAAQSLVYRSYEEPKLTFDTNLGGTVNILECIKNSSSVEAAVIITSDKCYQNIEQEPGYQEEDRLGGDDPYSASKACAEIASRAYIKSYFQDMDLGLATTRAGNVIGGGDWAENRIIPDSVRALSRKQELIIRNPEATRPWQHVLEPLSGYLWLGVNLFNNRAKVSGEAFNFGPEAKVVKSVSELVNLFLKTWQAGSWRHELANKKKESTLLQLNCKKAFNLLSWRPVLDFEETVRLTAEWYKNYYNHIDMNAYSCSQIDYYVKKAAEENLAWITKKIL